MSLFCQLFYKHKNFIYKQKTIGGAGEFDVTGRLDT